VLTKDLIRFRTINEHVKPQFIDTENPDLLELAKQLVSFYDPKNNLLRGEIDEAVMPIIKARKDFKIAQGLNKLMLDRCVFSGETENDYPGFRRNIFNSSANFLKSQDAFSYDDYREKIISENIASKDLIEKNIYADLPENEKLISVKSIFAKELLDRYNCALVQSLLFYSGKLTLEFEEPDPAGMRRLFKYLKFFRLLASVSAIGDNHTKSGQYREIEAPAKIKMEIDGPASLFENTQKYGLQLASFFPAICLLPKWEMETEIRLDKKELKLKLSQKSKLVSHYRNFSAYVPEEISMFHKLFKQKVTDWEIVGHTPFFDTGHGELIFPDLSFQNRDGVFSKTIHLELFHRWHSFQLLKRLEYCDKNPDIPMIIGIDRSLYKRPEIQSRADASPFFKEKSFLFNDFPGVEKVKKLLDSQL